MSTRKFLTAAWVALALVGWGVVTVRSAPQGQPSVGRGPITVKGCRIVWADERVVFSKTPGRIDRIYVDEGDPVEAGQVLAKLDDREAEVEYRIQKKQGDSELNIHLAETKVKEYETRADVSEVLYRKGAISLEELRLSKVNLEVNQWQAKLEVEKRENEQSKAERAKFILDDYTIESPIKGVVQKRHKREKEAVPANDLQMFRIVATDHVWVEGLVLATEVYRVRKGQGVEVRLTFDERDGAPPDEANEKFQGKIVFIDPDVDQTSRKFWVRAEVKNRSNKDDQVILHAGLKGQMTILFDDHAVQADRGKKGTTTK